MSSTGDQKPVQFNSINELNKYTEVKVNIKNALQCKQYCKSSNDIFKKAEGLYKSGDEENAYILYMRYFYIVMSIKATYEYSKAKSQFDPLLLQSNLKIAVNNAEKLQKSLSDRYSKKEEERRAEQERKLLLARQPKKTSHNEKGLDDLNIILPDVPNENTFAENSQPRVNTKNSNSHQNSTGEENKENLNTSNTQIITSIQRPIAGYMSVDHLYDLLKKNKLTPNSILLIDIRTAEEFIEARIQHSCMINIPDNLLQVGANINSIERKLTNDTWNIWSTRHDKNYLVIVDYDFDDDTAPATCAAYILQNVLCMFNGAYQVHILTGGFKEWHLHYPSLTTNPAYTKQPSYASIIDPFSLIQNLTYPELSTKHIESLVPGETSKPPPDVSTQLTKKTETIQPIPEKQLPMQMDKLAQLREMLKEKSDEQAEDVVVMGVPATDQRIPQSQENVLPKENIANGLEERKHPGSLGENFENENPKLPVVTDGVVIDNSNGLFIPDKLIKPNSTDHALNTQLNNIKAVGANHLSNRLSQNVMKTTSNDIKLSDVVSPTTASQLITTMSSTLPTVTNPATGKLPTNVVSPESELTTGPKTLLNTSQNVSGVSSVSETVLPVANTQINPEQPFAFTSGSSVATSKQHPQSGNMNNVKQKASTPKLANGSVPLPNLKPNTDKLPSSESSSPKNQHKSKIKSKPVDKNLTKQPPEFITTYGLPHGWEKAIHHDTGRVYFKDHNTRKTHWELPAEIKAKLMRNETPPADQEQELPEQQRATGVKENDKNKPTLKRSFSSPNLAEVVDKESKKPSASRPIIDRSNKPKEEKKVFADRSTKPISRNRLNNLSPVQGGKGRCLTGLKNLGNSCYMNSVLQCLSNTIPLAEYFYSSKFELDLNKRNMNPRPTEMARELAFILGVLSIGQYGSVSPIDFKLALGRFSSQFRGTEQQDAHELLMYLLDGFHEDVNKVKSRQKLREREEDDLADSVAADLSWRDYKLNNDSVIVDLFQGQFRSTVVCLSCNKKSKTFDAFNCLQLELPPNRSTGLEECIKSFTKPERIGGNDSWKCPHCKCYRTAEKTIEIWKLPKILIVQLKRFRFDGRWRNKIQTNVNFPVHPLDLTRFVANGSRTQYTKFHLYSVINHYGTFESGHYTAYCENASNSQWYVFDDNLVKDIDRNNVKTNAAYLLFYTAYDFKSCLK